VNFLQALGGRHLDAEIGPQPAPIIEAVLGDDLRAGFDQVAQPADDLFTIKVLAVGMSERNVDRVDGAIGAPCEADANDISAAPRPAWATVSTQPFVLGLGVDGDNVDAA